MAQASIWSESNYQKILHYVKSKWLEVNVNGKSQKKKKNHPELEIATINVRMAEKDSTLHQFITKFADANLDIICMQEIHRYKAGQAVIESIDTDKSSYDVY